MKAFFAAITSHFETANVLNTSLGGQLYPHEADSDAQFPYGIYYLLDDDPEKNFSDEFEYLQVQISLFSDSNSPGEILDIFEDQKAVFDDADFVVDGYKMLYFSRSKAMPKRDEEMGTWSCISEYEALLEKL